MSTFQLHATTVVGIIHNGKAAIGSDGQATLDKTVMKSTVKKVRKIGQGSILAGFAGSTADAFTLFERYEEKLSAYNENMQRAAVELAKDWRKDKYLQKLEALLVVMNNDHALIIQGKVMSLSQMITSFALVVVVVMLFQPLEPWLHMLQILAHEIWSRSHFESQLISTFTPIITEPF